MDLQTSLLPEIWNQRHLFYYEGDNNFKYERQWPHGSFGGTYRLNEASLCDDFQYIYHDREWICKPPYFQKFEINDIYFTMKVTMILSMSVSGHTVVLAALID